MSYKDVESIDPDFAKSLQVLFTYMLVYFLHSHTVYGMRRNYKF